MGCDGFLQKPIDARSFADKLRGYLDGWRETTNPDATGQRLRLPGGEVGQSHARSVSGGRAARTQRAALKAPPKAGQFSASTMRRVDGSGGSASWWKPSFAARVSIASFSLSTVADALWTDRSLVRTWAMRGTLHLLPARDYWFWQAALSTGYARFIKPSWSKASGLQPDGPFGRMGRSGRRIGRVLRSPMLRVVANPVSALASYEVFVRPALRAAFGHPLPHRPVLRASLTESLIPLAAKRQWRRARLDRAAGTVTPWGPPGSAFLGWFAGADALIDVPPGSDPLAPGDTVDVWDLANR